MCVLPLVLWFGNVKLPSYGLFAGARLGGVSCRQEAVSVEEKEAVFIPLLALVRRWAAGLEIEDLVPRKPQREKHGLKNTLIHMSACTPYNSTTLFLNGSPYTSKRTSRLLRFRFESVEQEAIPVHQAQPPARSDPPPGILTIRLKV